MILGKLLELTVVKLKENPFSLENSAKKGNQNWYGNSSPF